MQNRHRVTVKPKVTAAMLKAEQHQIVKVFGQRMKEARELSGLSQVKAAELLGYANSATLSKIEACVDKHHTPPWLIKRAAFVYQVSADYLLGLSEDWERSAVVAQQRDIVAFIVEHEEVQRAAQINGIRVLENKLFTVQKAVSHAIKRSLEFKSLIDRFRELNQEFDDLKLGAKLLRYAYETTEEATFIAAELKRYNAFVDMENKGKLNRDIFDEDSES